MQAQLELNSNLNPNPDQESLDVLYTDLFYQVMQGVANELQLNMEFLHGGWKVIFSSPTTQEYYELLNYDIGLNSSQAAFRAKDKSMCYSYLNKAGVSAIEHLLLHSSTYRFAEPETIKHTIQRVKDAYGFPLVVKQNNGGGGKNIFFAFDEVDLTLALSDLFKRNLTATLSPFYEFTTEYRCTVLDNQVEMSYGKTKGDNLQNNLSKGAQVVPVPDQIKGDVHNLAIQANKALGLRFSNVDIVNTHEGLKVLEVNDTVALKRVTRNSVEKHQQAINVYVKAIKALRNTKITSTSTSTSTTMA